MTCDLFSLRCGVFVSAKAYYYTWGFFACYMYISKPLAFTCTMLSIHSVM